ncbi:Agamous-like MADS-box protein AGL65 [Camellia lanceoleosa]|uniref:Agamous-like MADS-box protein AGL65 n=1 Tax=Camellia lanceoleosa TaxID=1840588 RepID=A0ACC0H2Z7_9ERIC|nr:Agamous-like MADS-box protein AGL65 [Camellia lanceoleosa]
MIFFQVEGFCLGHGKCDLFCLGHGKWMMDEFVAVGISKKLGIIGFCFGGGRLIDTLTQDGGTCFGIGVSFYGTRIDPSVIANIKVPVLFIVGDNDSSCLALKKTFRKLDHDVNIQDFLGSSTQSIEVSPLSLLSP